MIRVISLYYYPLITYKTKSWRSTSIHGAFISQHVYLGWISYILKKFHSKLSEKLLVEYCGVCAGVLVQWYKSPVIKFMIFYFFTVYEHFSGNFNAARSVDGKYEPYAGNSMPLQARPISVPLLCLVWAKCTFHLIVVTTISPFLNDFIFYIYFTLRISNVHLFF